MPKSQSALATEFCRVGPVSSTESDSLTGDTVKMAFIPYGTAPPAAGDWHVAAWDTDGNDSFITCLVGPANGGVVLAPGQYRVWVQVVDDPEIPTAAVDTLTIT